LPKRLTTLGPSDENDHQRACQKSWSQLTIRRMADIELLATPKPESFACPNCGARYTLVRADHLLAAVAERQSANKKEPEAVYALRLGLNLSF
jgi:hypothetical protein